MSKTMLNEFTTKRSPKVWQFWMPQIIGVNYSIYYVPKIARNIFRRNLQYVLGIDYLNKGKQLFIVPKGLIPATLLKQKAAVIGSAFMKSKHLLRPYVASVLTTLVGLTFRFKLFLRVKGLGYKAYVVNAGKTLNLKLGLSHVVAFNFQNEMFATKLGIKDRMFSVEGSNWVILTNVVARIQSLRRIDYYRGKGIFKKFYSCKIRQSRKKKK